MTTTFLQWSLPTAVSAKAGASAALSAIVTRAFGGLPGQWSRYYLTYYPASQLKSWNFDYWSHNATTVSNWAIGGAQIGGGFDNQVGVAASDISTARFVAGSDIGAFAYLSVQIAANEYVQYSIPVVNPKLMSATAGKATPTAADIVAAAYRFDKYYGFVVNNNDCHHIASDVAAAAGATLTDLTYSGNPSQNQEGGFWRIAYRGSQKNPVADWQTLVRPGDIVRMGWKTGGCHTATVLKVNKNGSIVVYDNDAYVNGVEGTSVHTVNYQTETIASTITIYRLTTDSLYLESGTSASETLQGTTLNDKIVALGGNDTLIGGLGADHLYGGAGANAFVYKSIADSTVAASGRDMIEDFIASQGDRIDLSAIDADTKLAGHQDFTFIGGKALGGAGGELDYKIVGNDTFLFGETNGSKSANFEIELVGKIALTAKDFIL